MKKNYIVMVIVGVLLIGFGGLYTLLKKPAPATTPTTTTNTNTTVPVTPVPDPNNPKPLPGTPAPGDMPANGPQNDETYITFSSNGADWQPGTLVAKQSSVPDLVQLHQDVGTYKKGNLLVYAVSFSSLLQPSASGLGMLSSSDNGKTWSQVQNVNINLPSGYGAADPSVVQLADGRLRLYFFSSPLLQGQDPASSPNPHKVDSAISTDGVNFTMETGDRLLADNLTDPDIVQFNNAWYLYYSSGPSFGIATSSDGLTFTNKNISSNIGGVPGAMTVSNGVRIFTCGPNGLNEAVASDGLNFTVEQNDIFHGQIKDTVCDAGPIQLLDGTYAMVYKVRPMDTSTQPNTTQPKQ